MLVVPYLDFRVGDEPQPGRADLLAWRVHRETGIEVVQLRCPDGAVATVRQTIGGVTTGHKIADDGTVSPSVLVRSKYPGCAEFHEFVRLDGWPPAEGSEAG